MEQNNCQSAKRNFKRMFMKQGNAQQGERKKNKLGFQIK